MLGKVGSRLLPPRFQLLIRINIFFDALELIAERLEQLQEIRNLLAHLKNIPAELLHSDILNRFFETEVDILPYGQDDGDDPSQIF